MAKATRVYSTPPTNTSVTRRRALGTIAAGATALTVAPARAAAPAADPIFNLIEAHRSACTAHLDALKVQNRIEKIRGVGAADWITEKPCHDENEAFAVLVAAAVTTPPALLAKLGYLQEIAESDEWGWVFDEREGTALALIESFVASFQNIMVQP